MAIRVGGICTGYAGIELGLVSASVDIASGFHAEIEPGPVEVLAAEWSGVPNLGDVKTADFGAWRGCVDLMVSGDPCQSISVAGRRAGREDPRFLWPWVREAYRAIDAPRILFENVANMKAHDGGRTMAERFEHLRADGYAVRWTILGACAVGAPHHRHRWFALAEKVLGVAPEAVRMGGDKAVCGAPRSGGRALLPFPMTTDATGGPGVSDKRTGGMNLRTAVNLLPTPVARDGDGRNEGDADYWRRKYERDPARADKGVPLGAAINLLPGAAVHAWGKYAEAVTLWEAITGIPAPEPTVIGPKGGRRLNPALPEWMMGLRPGLLTRRLDRNAALKAAGNGVVPLAVAAAWDLLAH